MLSCMAFQRVPELGPSYLQRAKEPLDDLPRRMPLGALDAAEVGAIHLGQVGQAILRQATRATASVQREAEGLEDRAGVARHARIGTGSTPDWRRANRITLTDG